MNTSFLNTNNLPFCKGCGHDLVSKNTAKALDILGLEPKNVVVVTDIGCHGIIDKALNAHTVHGLHGRSVALATGLSLGIQEPGKKVIVFLGDGGATIGLQHIIEAARLNLNMSIVIHNNYLYGMTGGQTSGLTPEGFKTTTAGNGNTFAAHDLCALTHAAGASYVTRLMGIGDFSDKLAEAYNTKGCSVIEVIELCPSYGVKFNPNRKLRDIALEAGKPEGVWKNDRAPFNGPESNFKEKYLKTSTKSLLDKLEIIDTRYQSKLNKGFSIVLSGSAGEGVQLAAGIITKAALSCGLNATQKGSYPVTVGVGFSSSEINLSPDAINYHGMDIPDLVIVTSDDGLAYSLKKIKQMQGGTLIIDKSLPIPETNANVISFDFRSLGAKNACILASLYFADKLDIIPRQAMLDMMESSGLAAKLPLEKMLDVLNQA